jgi:phosphopantothenoylcysteine decarboxylase / phosphopantothenate---cysteine ligase
VIILGPDSGDQACGETGMGRMLEPEALLAEVESFFATRNVPKSLAGVAALVTAGPTFEAIDPVRGITNSSSGKMGYAIAESLRNAGAAVTLITGPTSLAIPAGMKAVQVKSASEMLSAVMHKIDEVKLFFAVAAVADYTPVAPSAQKMKKSGKSLTIELAPTVDIIATVAALPDPPFCVGFAAESENVVEYARKKRESKRIPVIVANLATEAIGANDNQVTLIDGDGEHPMPKATKAQIAAQIVAHVAELYLKQHSTDSAEIDTKSNIKSLKPPRIHHA